MKKKKSSNNKKNLPKKVKEDVQENYSPVCYANSKDLRDEFKEEKK